MSEDNKASQPANGEQATPSNNGTEATQLSSYSDKATEPATDAKASKQLQKLNDQLAELQAALVQANAERDAALEMVVSLKQELKEANLAAGRPVEFTVNGKAYKFTARRFKISDSDRYPELKPFAGKHSSEEAAENAELCAAIVAAGLGIFEEA